jgi:cytochrome b pre-mRNA-processing protein 3
MALFGLFRRSSEGGPAATLYDAVVAQSRRPEFFENLGVPDSVDGRFDMIALHAFLLLRRLKDEKNGAEGLPQKFFDTMFGDMDRSLREMGAGDLGVGKRVKAMAKSFYGRIAAYERGLAGPAGELEDALARNLYGTIEGDPAHIAAMAQYMRREAQGLERQSGADLLSGRVVFGGLADARDADLPA